MAWSREERIAYASRTWGPNWGKRVEMELDGKSPPGPFMTHACNECSGYGQPGWKVVNNEWVRCVCNDRKGA